MRKSSKSEVFHVCYSSGFEASKAEVGQPDKLIQRYPQSETLINRLAPPRQLPATSAGAADAADDSAADDN